MNTDTAQEMTRVTQVLAEGDRGRVLRVQQVELHVVAGPDKGLVREVGAGLRVGSGEECNLVLSDSTVSRQHCELALADDGYRLRDLGSRNGTHVHGLRIESALLDRECSIQVGSTELALRFGAGHRDLPLSEATRFGSLLGASLPMRQAFALLERAAGSDSTVLLEGETGTGKDLAAESLHAASSRAEMPFLVVDCGAMAATLIQSELFGHARGAFSGADRDRAGVFESAEGGTVFLDEIGELDLALQPQLLRLLEKRELRRLGENRYRPVDIRVLAATHRDLEREVEAGRFRQDLFYRLSVLRVRLPPLRDRRDDLPVLARGILHSLAPQSSSEELITPTVLGLLTRYDWPGNVRELRNVLERLLLFPDAPEHAVPTTLARPKSPDHLLVLPFHEAKREVQDRFEREYLGAALERAGGVVTRAAELSDLPRQSFHRLLAKHQLER
ncbi:MAG: sigma 54-interacting transcriptional regulator [Pseudomonadota bacterium]